MVPDTKGGLKVEFQKVKARLSTLTAQFMKVNGSLVIHMDKAC